MDEHDDEGVSTPTDDQIRKSRQESARKKAKRVYEAEVKSASKIAEPSATESPTTAKLRRKAAKRTAAKSNKLLDVQAPTTTCERGHGGRL